MENNNNKLGRMDRSCFYLSRHRMGVLLVIAVITAIFSYGLLRIKGEVLIHEMFPYDHPYLKLNYRFAQVFGSGSSGVLIAVRMKNGDIFTHKTLSKIKKMTDEVELWDEVYRMLTVSIMSNSIKVVKTLSKGEIAVKTLMGYNIPENEQELEVVKKNIFSNPAYGGVFVSEDGTSAIIITEFKENISYQRAFGLLQKLRKEYTDDETSIHIVGFPMLMGWIYSLKSQTFIVFAISIVAMIVVLWLIFYGNALGMIVVMCTSLILTVWGLGFIGFTGMNFNPLLYVLAFLVASRMIGNAHQITYRYFEESESAHGDREKACYETMRSMWTPNAAAVAADVAGFSVLFLAKIILMQHLAIIMTFWVLTILLTAFLVPAVCTLIPLKLNSKFWAKETCQEDWLARGMVKMSKFSIGPFSRYVTGGLIIILTVFCLWQTTKLKVGDPTPGSPLLWPNHPYNQDQDIFNEKFNASSENLTLFFEGKQYSVYDPEVMLTFDRFSRHMAGKLPDIYKTSSSIINMVEILNMTLHDGHPLWYQLPRNHVELTGIFGQLRKTVDVPTMRRFFDSQLEKAQITIFFSDHTSDNLLRIRDAAYGFFKDYPMKIEAGQFSLAGGRIGMEIALNEEMKKAHLQIDLVVYAAIFLLCILFYRSIVAGLMLTLPLILANGVALTYMSLKGMGLSVNTLPIAAVGAGLGVDFAIYLYSRAMEEFPNQGRDWYNTIVQSICTCGKAVVFTGLTIIFPILTWYFFSDMKFQAEVGFFLAMIMGTNVLLALTLHPLMIYIIKPKFISREAFKNANVKTEQGTL